MRETLLLSQHSSTPMYAQIVEQIVAKVVAGAWPPGHALPSIRELASASQTSVITVKRAYLELERGGVIVTRQGKGSFVADTLDLPRTRALEEFRAHLARLLNVARTLGFGRDDILAQVGDAISQLADASAPPPDSSED